MNGSQLFATNSNVTTNANNIAANTASIAGNTSSITSLTNGTIGLVKQDATTNAITVAADKAGNSISLVGTDGNRTLTGVAAGTLSGTSTDAVNGSQLFATNSNVTTNANNIGSLGTSTASALGGGAAYNTSTGAWTAPSYSIQGTSYNNVGSALGGVDSSLTNLSNSVAAGSTGVVQRTATANVATLTAANGTAAAPGTAQKLTNLAAGTLSGTSTDAVNGSQLFATNSNVTTNANNIGSLGTSTASALGGGAAYNTSTGAWTAPSYSIQGTSYNNVGSALGGVDSSLTNLSNSVAAGSTGVVQRTATANVATLTAANGTAAAPGTAQKLTNLAAGTLSGTSTDAVNGSQLFATNSNVTTNANNIGSLGTSTASALGGGAAYNTSTGAWTAPSYSIQGTSYNNVGSALGGVDSSLTNLSNSVAAGSTGVVQRTATANVATLTAANGTAAAPGTAQKLTNLAAGTLSGTSTDAVNGSQLYTVADQVSKNTTDIAGLTNIVNNATENNLVKQNGNSEDNSISIGAGRGGRSISVTGNEGDRTLSGVADGVEENDVATVGQLQGVVGNISSRDDTGLGVAKATGKDGLAVGAGAVASGDFSTSSGAGAQATGANSSASGSGAKATAANATALGQGSTASGTSTLAGGQGSSATGTQTVALGAGSNASGLNSVALGYGSVAERDNSVSVGSVGNERQITNVAAGTARTDAANVGQVNDAFQSLGDSVNKRISDLDDKLTGGIASAMALSGIPQAYLPDSSLVGASASTYKGQSAIAIGVSKTSENGKWIMKISGTGNTQSDFGGTVGVGYQW
ncbi:YadA family autotransporter adhesin [Serratia fonticola]|uniref:YadA family autotransporter adhesin n=1 Tax=Serratia fonticola TaxID=47917 RepID=UPI0014153703|nr:YadA family autotransporter adhesin [Serratia fonticola]QIP94551.1 hypothetical protein HAP32_05179 [Serratia fonticola]